MLEHAPGASRTSQCILLSSKASLQSSRKAASSTKQKHPRWPAGAPESQGGRFAPGDGSGGFSISTEPPEAAPLLQTGRSVGRLPGPPKIPDLRPLGRLAYATVKDISRWAQAALELGEVHLVHNLLLGIEAIQWLNGKPGNHSDEIKASLDEPKTLKRASRCG